MAGIVERIANGDEEALESVIAAQTRRLTNIVRHMIGDPGYVEDILQETFLRLWRKAATIRNDDHLQPWLVTTARNLARDHLRRHKYKVEEARDAIAIGGLLVATIPGPEQTTILKLEIQAILGRMHTNPASYIRTMELRGLGLEYEQIASIQGIPAGTVKSRINFGRKKAAEIAVELGWEERRVLA